ncbi:hypothetical protein TRFO_27920 [Tritrichomonas foetus]|uniref:EF-hand domain-containing protein n=1 Tax=Tritrichomonas foetus TaxID=1144522 RepID=A0A1J4K511_9EUKA|nr:hypothetical protein TRFO_27920 [Tritrichomonas foetus]|eukprot:OHT04589.1 hypothetical protein TRFO_27920 [Tritrichomonas foetus]
MEKTKIDYALLIETFRQYDTEECGILSYSQYEELTKSMNICENNSDYVKIAYKALCTIYKNVEIGINFENVRLIYESASTKIKTKLNSLILFRGVDDDRDGRIDSHQFKRIALLVNSSLTDCQINQLFQKCSPDEKETVSYSHVARKVFHVSMTLDEDPYSMKLMKYSHLSNTCLLI